MYAIEVKNLKKNYDDVKAVKGISFTVEKDSFFAFLGPNGAGKSTTINIISTLLSKSGGEISVLGHRLSEDDNEIRKQIGVVFQGTMLDELLTVRENLVIRGSFYGLTSKGVDERVLEINDLLEIMPFINQRYGLLSGGQKRKADIARALLNWPKILILDEPTTGLDPKSRSDIWTLIEYLRKNHSITIFLTTHYMEEVIDANKVVIIDNGTVIAEGSSEDLRLKYSSDRIKIIPLPKLKEVLRQDNIEFTELNGLVHVVLESCFAGIEFVNKYKSFIKEFEILRGNMDDVFLNITGRKLVEL